MTYIESGTTGERRTRTLIFLGMCTFFAGWFAYDGIWGYPAKNVDWARQALPEKPAELKADSRVVRANLRKIQAGMPLEQVEELLGPPVLVQKREKHYIGPETIAIIRFDDDGLVTEVVRDEMARRASQEATGELAPVQRHNFRVTPERLDRIQVGMSESDVALILDEPAAVQGKRLWFVGPAAYATVELGNDVVAGIEARESPEPSEGDIFMQKVLAVGLGFLSLGMAIHVIRIVRLRVILDDNGLTFRSLHIPFDSMTGLDTEPYARKGWVNLLYTQDGAERMLRLDSYHINRFNDIVDGICERKGFAPLPPPPSSEDEQEQEQEAA